MAFIKHVKNGVVYYASDLLSCPHAFSTRIGGVSALPHLRSMNLGNNRGDDPANVAENFNRICTAADLPHQVVSAKQIHSKTVAYVTSVPETKPELDGFVTDCPGITLCVKTADCLPVLLYDPSSSVIAALHAGWRGSAKNIVGAGIEKMRALGAAPASIFAAVGAGIGSCCFEVKDDFITEFKSYLGNDAGKYLVRRGQKIFADLKTLNADLLKEAGVLPEHIDISPLCTCCDPETFFSHRASGGVRGTMGALIALPGRN